MHDWSRLWRIQIQMWVYIRSLLKALPLPLSSSSPISSGLTQHPIVLVDLWFVYLTYWVVDSRYGSWPSDHIPACKSSLHCPLGPKRLKAGHKILLENLLCTAMLQPSFEVSSGMSVSSCPAFYLLGYCRFSDLADFLCLSTRNCFLCKITWFWWYSWECCAVSYQTFLYISFFLERLVMFSGLCWILHEDQYQCNWFAERRGRYDSPLRALIILQSPFPVPEHTVFSRVKFLSEIKGFLLLGAEHFPGTATQNETQDKCSWYYTVWWPLFLVIGSFQGFILSNLFIIFSLKWQINWSAITSHDVRVCSTSVSRETQVHKAISFTLFQACPVNPYLIFFAMVTISHHNYEYITTSHTLKRKRS